MGPGSVASSPGGGGGASVVLPVGRVGSAASWTIRVSVVQAPVIPPRMMMELKMKEKGFTLLGAAAAVSVARKV